MSEQANEEKVKGNAAMSAGNFEEAVAHYTKGIELDSTNHVLFSNRAAAYAQQGKYTDSLEDAEKTIELKPDWPRGYSRQAVALTYLERLPEAAAAYKKGLEVEPSNESFKQGLKDVQARMARQQQDSMNAVFGQLFQGDMWGKLRANPKTAAYLNDSAFVNLLNQIQSNPGLISQYLGDPRISEVMGVLMGLDKFKEEEEPKKEEKKPEPEKKEEEKEPEPELSEEKKMALDEKVKGNEAYKQKNFEEALAHYQKAFEYDPTDMTFQNNMAAVYFEMKDYDKCIQQCEEALETGKKNFADFRLQAKALARIGNAYVRQEKYDEAIKAFNSSLTEDRTRTTLQALRRAEKLQKEKQERDYYSPEKALEAKEEGNEHFRNGRFPEAVECYSEAIKRNPEDHVLYSNRAACYTKLGAYPLGLKDCDECIRLKPDFVKAYSRKGAIQFFMKDYHKCLETYDQGLKFDPENEELTNGVKRTITAINQRNTQETDKNAAARAAADPEIQEILRDPMIQQVLSQMQQNPAAAQGYLQDPMIMAKLQKLIAAGIIKVA
eukprot:CAMPEP_0174259432 /NCGR_PEP_ID=MMETSP0439-20130205/8252_1 /TAXON_ID=0 /ORGANISM="Stereomyxa ramosa, Strain Chinc5" /LENGTH=550 /DNA_ID=CAMNT_0015343319 /DNA_START=36 /DNA_END=1685 /DNA_ORIENTATION=+